MLNTARNTPPCALRAGAPSRRRNNHVLQAVRCQRSRQAVRTRREHHPAHARARAGHVASSDSFDLRFASPAYRRVPSQWSRGTSTICPSTQLASTRRRRARASGTSDRSGGRAQALAGLETGSRALLTQSGSSGSERHAHCAVVEQLASSRHAESNIGLREAASPRTSLVIGITAPTHGVHSCGIGSGTRP
jgi:hypothetical protein